MTMMFKNLIQRLTGMAQALLVGFLLFSSGTARAQMRGLRTGKLPNGLTYYIYNDGSASGEAQYYLYQNGGAILETTSVDHRLVGGQNNLTDHPLRPDLLHRVRKILQNHHHTPPRLFTLHPI